MGAGTGTGTFTAECTACEDEYYDEDYENWVVGWE